MSTSLKIFLTLFALIFTALLVLTLIELGRSDKSKPFGRRFKTAFTAAGHKIGMFNSRVILTVFYIFPLSLWAIPMTLFGDNLRTKKKYTWTKRTTRDLSLEDARRQG